MFSTKIQPNLTLTPLIAESRLPDVAAVCAADELTGVGRLCKGRDLRYLIRQTQQLWAMTQGMRVLITHDTQPIGLAEVLVNDGLAALGYCTIQPGVMATVLRTLVDYMLDISQIEQVVLRCPVELADCHELTAALGLREQYIARSDTRYAVPIDQWQRATPPIFKYPLDDETYLQMLHINHADTVRQVIDDNRDYLRRWLPDMALIHDRDDVREYIGRGLSNLADGHGFQCGIWHRGALIGVIAYNFIDRTASYTELGYWLVEGFQGRGWMTQAVHALTAYAFDELGLQRVGLRIAANNQRSRALAERLGFDRDAALRHTLWLYEQQSDHVLYVMRSHDWWQRQQKATDDGLSAQGRS